MGVSLTSMFQPGNLNLVRMSIKAANYRGKFIVWKARCKETLASSPREHLAQDLMVKIISDLFRIDHQLIILSSKTTASATALGRGLSC